MFLQVMMVGEAVGTHEDKNCFADLNCLLAGLVKILFQAGWRLILNPPSL